MDRKIYNQIITEHFDMNNHETRKTLVYMNEAEQNQMLVALASKLYNAIVSKVDKIDYGKIPESKGDITKIPNYPEMMECLDTIRELLIEYKQSTEPADIIFETIDNLKKTKRVWEKAFATETEMPIVMYNTIALSVVSSTSLLISASVELVKDPTDKSYKLFLDKAGAAKTQKWLLYKNLKTFNKGCKNGDIEESMMAMIGVQKNVIESCLTEESIGGAIWGIAKKVFTGTTLIILIRFAIPLLHQLTSLFYEMKQSISDFFDHQADLVRLNAESLKYDYTKSDAARDEIVKKQNKIADKFKKISNMFMVKIKVAETNANKEIESTNNSKLNLDDITPKNTGSSIFY